MGLPRGLDCSVFRGPLRKSRKLDKTMLKLVTLILGIWFSQVSDAQEFYAFQNGLSFGSTERDVAVLKELGYSGVSQVNAGGTKLAEQVAAYEQEGLKVLSVYLNVDDHPIAAETIKPLANRDALVELTIRKMSPETIRAVRETAQTAASMNIRVALYPHYGFAVATLPQAMELIEQVNHPNLGVMFNLCHFLRGEDPQNLERILTRADDRLFAVSICGADTNGKSWKELIQTLDQGTFPQKRLLNHLKSISFDGPITLQCYGIDGDKRLNLERSMDAWKTLNE